MTSPTPTPEEIANWERTLTAAEEAGVLTGETEAILRLTRYIAAQSQALAEREDAFNTLDRRHRERGRQWDEERATLTAENRRLQTELSAANDVLAAGVEPRRQLDEWRRLCVTGACESRLEQWRNFEELRARLTTTEKERDDVNDQLAAVLVPDPADESALLNRLTVAERERDEARERIGALVDVLGRAATVIDRYGHFVRYGDLRHDISALLADAKPEGQQ